jgi:hypothetical protein
MKKFIIAAALLCASTPALAATKADAMRTETVFLALSAVDLGQTVYCLDKVKGCEEANPIFGKHPKAWQLIAAKVAFGGLHFVLVDRLADKNPKAALRVAQVSVVLQGTIVGLNARVIF